MRVHLGTNATLWTRANWDAMGGLCDRVRSTHISIDAATPATYAINRRGGAWDRLMENLGFVSSLRRNGPLGFVSASFVVQRNNYREMPAFVDMVRRFGFDLAYFQKIEDWGTYSRDDYLDRAVHLARHPEHHLLLEILADPVFRHPEVGLYCFGELRNRALRVRGGVAGFRLLGWRNVAARAAGRVLRRFRSRGAGWIR